MTAIGPDAVPSAPARLTLHGMRHVIDGWKGPGSGEVFETCDAYLAALESLLADAEAAGLITRLDRQ